MTSDFSSWQDRKKREMPADLPADRLANAQFARTLPPLCDYSLRRKFARSISSTWRKTCNSNTDSIPGVTAFIIGRPTIIENRGHFARSDKREAERLLNAMNESHREPTINLESGACIFGRPRPQNGATNVASGDGRNGHARNSNNAGAMCPRISKQIDHPSAANHSCKQPAKIYSRSFTRTETASPTISDDFTTWLSISGGSRGPSRKASMVTTSHRFARIIRSRAAASPFWDSAPEFDFFIGC